jgi:hypothetical protein
LQLHWDLAVQQRDVRGANVFRVNAVVEAYHESDRQSEDSAVEHTNLAFPNTTGLFILNCR